MNKKKVQALIVAGLLTVGVIGGTLAWFTSQDKITNVFNTGATDDPANPDAGIDIEENFPGAKPDGNGDMVYDKPVLPGDVITKEVSVTSKAEYDQFLRAKMTKVWKLSVAQTTANGGPQLAKGAEVTHYKETADGKVIYRNGAENGWTALDYNKIELTLEQPGNTESNSWSASENDAAPAQGYYYFNAILKGSKTDTTSTKFPKTGNLLKSVTFKAETGKVDNFYKNLTFDVKVEAEGIQASHGAAEDAGWSQSVILIGIPGYNK